MRVCAVHGAQARSGLGAAVLDKHIYIAGGASDTLFGSVVLSSVER
jgi:hypothetical protein